MALRIGFDLGGTKMEAVVVDEEMSVLHRLRRPTPREDGYEAVVAGICGVIEDLEKEAGQSCYVGIGTPGAISQVTGRMKNSNTLCLNDMPLKEAIEARLGKTIRMANDANCFALSEAIDGAAAGKEIVFGVIIGTGVGGGLVINGRVREGLHGIAGEWGHNILDPRGPKWFDNQYGPVEAYLCGGGLGRLYEVAGGPAGADGKTVVDKMRAGDKLANEAFDEYIRSFGKAICPLLHIVDPDAIVLGGGLSNVDEIYERLPEAVLPNIFNDEFKTPVVKNKWGDSGGVRGAALLWSLEDIQTLES